MIAQSTIDQIKDRASLIEIAGEVLTLKRQGSGFVGLCPFHAEKSPSFHVRGDGSGYHCFGCGAAGNVLSFVMQYRGISFPEAVEDLASRYNIEIKREGRQQKSVSRLNKEIFYKLNQVAFEFFQSNLRIRDEVLFDYLKKRGLTKDAIHEFGIGAALSEWRALSEHLSKLDVGDDLLVQSGLVRRNPRGELYDTFRGRLIFPVWIDDKKISGFGGRLVPGWHPAGELKSLPKYLNSPESPVYQKHKIFYGLPQALKVLREENEIYLVEGYMDVVALSQSGVRNVLATCGTAVTTEHAKRLARLVPRVVLLFDGDDAGRSAAAKSFQVFLNSGIDVSAVFLDQKHDPDSFAKEHRANTRQALLGLKRRPLFDCYVLGLSEKYGANSITELGAAAKGKLSADLLSELKRIENGIEQRELVRRAAFLLQTDETLLLKSLDPGSVMPQAVSQERPQEVQAHIESIRAVDQLPAVDREVLISVIARKESLPDQVLRDAILCNGLQSETLSFIGALQAVLASELDSEEQKKEQIKHLLNEYGSSWIDLWKRSFRMSQEPDIDHNEVIKGCRQAIQKSNIIQELKALDLQISGCTNDSQLIQLNQEKLALARRLSTL
ncbi:MAG: DNA primase [Bdellovibrionales bacterium]|nr:DNA primase [Bdellovibrionales bacterium]